MRACRIFVRGLDLSILPYPGERYTARVMLGTAELGTLQERLPEILISTPEDITGEGELERIPIGRTDEESYGRACERLLAMLQAQSQRRAALQQLPTILGRGAFSITTHPIARVRSSCGLIPDDYAGALESREAGQ